VALAAAAVIRLGVMTVPVSDRSNEGAGAMFDVGSLVVCVETRRFWRWRVALVGWWCS